MLELLIKKHKIHFNIVIYFILGGCHFETSFTEYPPLAHFDESEQLVLLSHLEKRSSDEKPFYSKTLIDTLKKEDRRYFVYLVKSTLNNEKYFYMYTDNLDIFGDSDVGVYDAGSFQFTDKGILFTPIFRREVSNKKDIEHVKECFNSMIGGKAVDRDRWYYK
ncbi:hypothetical protein R9C00_10905 [Flammeovirgaceae bacterium SG7u.111]|nr:hypothetical protein [Flammeovirgaceae bacterium SG7u.132]WPO37959.1 hypothetical protein R9C00_10905 [Flammeovirgaceae bacterium SG7u.111]